MPPALRTALAAGLLATAVAGCTSGSSSDGPQVPAESAFAEGTCRAAAPDVRAVGETLPRLGDGGRVDDEVKATLREAQERLRALAEGMEPSLQPAFTDLGEKIGLVRIRADGNTYEPELGEALTTSYEQVLEVCTGKSAG